jgi:hypothetical protein
MAGEDTAATAVDRFQDRIPASLYEIAWQYSLLDWFASAESDDIDWELAPEHLAYLTPREKDGLFGADDSLIVVYADLSDPGNPTLRDDTVGGPIDITTYTERDRFRVGHSYPPGRSSSMTDYSITTYKNASAHHIAGLREDAYWTNNVQDRFTKWPQGDAADAVREDEDTGDADRAILDGLAALGNDQDAMERLADSLLAQVESEDESLDALITIRTRLPGEDRYKYPGEISVLNDVMQAKKATRLENISVEDASGEGVGYVTGAETLVTGGSAGLFGMYANKQREHVPNLDPRERTPGGSVRWTSMSRRHSTWRVPCSASSPAGSGVVVGCSCCRISRPESAISTRRRSAGSTITSITRSKAPKVGPTATSTRFSTASC